ncbi:MAG: hypothetical protein R2825_10745 [Saprospiraceae bacterium]
MVATGFILCKAGLRAVIYTDMVQAFILLLGCIVVTLFGLYQIGGWGSDQYRHAAAGRRPAHPPVERFFLIYGGPQTIPNTLGRVYLFGAPIMGCGTGVPTNILCSGLCQQKISAILEGALFAGFKLLRVFIFFIQSVIAYALLQKRGRSVFRWTMPTKRCPP